MEKRPGVRQRYTDAERAERHFQRYGTYDLPPRGTGLTRGSGNIAQGEISAGTGLLFVLGAFVGIGALIAIASKK